jgi:anti-sigma regulatory factor (Ser/Thr protein kinase)
MTQDEAGTSAGRRSASADSAHGLHELASLTLDRDAPGAARAFVTGLLHGRIAPSLLEVVQLLVSELVTNSVRHSGAGPGASLAVRVHLRGGLLRLEVDDPGRQAAIAARSPDGDGGFGLHLVQALSERWGVERPSDGGTRVWAQLPCAPRTAHASLGPSTV